MVVGIGESDEFPFHRLLEDAHVDLVIKRQQLVSKLPVDEYFLEVDDPLFDLVIDCAFVKELVVLEECLRVYPISFN